jgi:hypothetical protein
MSFNSVNIGKVIYSLVNATVPSYPVIAPQTTNAPYLVYNILTNDPDDTKDGPAMVDRVTVLLSIYESTYALAASKGNAVRTLLDAFSGTAGGVAVNSIVFVTESDDYDYDNKLHVKTQEYVFRVHNTSSQTLPGLSVQVTESVSSNGIIGIVETGYELNEIVALQVPTTQPPNSYAGFDYGTTAGASNLAAAVQVANTGESTKTVVNMFLSHTGNSNVYASSDNWNGGNFTFILIKSKTS